MPSRKAAINFNWLRANNLKSNSRLLLLLIARRGSLYYTQSCFHFSYTHNFIAELGIGIMEKNSNGRGGSEGRQALDSYIENEDRGA